MLRPPRDRRVLPGRQPGRADPPADRGHAEQLLRGPVGGGGGGAGLPATAAGAAGDGRRAGGLSAGPQGLRRGWSAVSRKPRTTTAAMTVIWTADAPSRGWRRGRPPERGGERGGVLPKCRADRKKRCRAK